MTIDRIKKQLTINQLNISLRFLYKAEDLARRHNKNEVADEVHEVQLKVIKVIGEIEKLLESDGISGVIPAGPEIK